MMYNLLQLALLAVVLCIIWRICSTYYSLPLPSWLSWMVEFDNPFAKAHKANQIIDSLPINKKVKIIDIGCGPGRILLPLAKKVSSIGGYVVGLDIQSKMIEKSFYKAKKLDIQNIGFINGDVDKIPVNEKYDIVTMVCVLGEIPQKKHRTTIKKLKKHLQPDGIISITETIFDPHFQKYKNIAELMRELGFENIKFFGNYFAYTAHFKKVE